jgi:hypothetical protein
VLTQWANAQQLTFEKGASPRVSPVLTPRSTLP